MANDDTSPELPSQGPVAAEPDPEQITDGFHPVVEPLPEGLSVADTIEWVGLDKTRAQTALAAEGDDGRKTLVEHLEKVVGEDTGAGIASGEA